MLPLFGRLALATGNGGEQERLLFLSKLFERLSNENILSNEEVNQLTVAIHDILQNHQATLDALQTDF